MLGRKPIIAANWKMHKTLAESETFIREFRAILPDPGAAEVVICPPATALSAVARAIEGTPYKLSAQNVYWEKSGAFTGEISPLQLKDVGCHYVIIGHSERRQYFAENDQTVSLKLKAAFAAGIVPILCVGESRAERETGRTDEVVSRQVRAALVGLRAAEVSAMVVAYEPIWAIGTGLAATAADAQAVAGLIREAAAALVGREGAESLRIQYGGSVKPENTAEFMVQPDIDGALVGGASLEAASFAGIVRAAGC